jgi:ankyrin repeat protein
MPNELSKQFYMLVLEGSEKLYKRLDELIDKGADINVRNNFYRNLSIHAPYDNYTPLTAAVMKADVETVEYLLNLPKISLEGALAASFQVHSPQIINMLFDMPDINLLKAPRAELYAAASKLHRPDIIDKLDALGKIDTQAFNHGYNTALSTLYPSNIELYDAHWKHELAETLRENYRWK